MANTFTQIYIQTVFSPKNRNYLIQQDWENNLQKYITGIVRKKGHKLIAINGMPDHIHIVVRTKPSMSLSKAAQLLKGRSSYEFFRKHPNMRLRYRKGHFWAPSSCYLTTGSVDLDQTRTYVRNQSDLHQATLNNWSS